MSQKGERLARNIEDNQPIQLYKYFKKTINNLDDTGQNFGSRVENAFKDTMGSSTSGTGLLGKRALQAKNDFSAATKEITAIPLHNTLQTIDDLVNQLSDVGTGSQAKALAKNLSSLKDELVEGTITPTQMQNLLHTWGSAAKGTGKLFTDIDKAAEYRPAKMLYSALNNDLNAAIDNNPGAALLKKARDNYRLNTDLINEVQDTALGKLFGGLKNPSLADVESAFSKMKPDQITSTMNILSKTDPTIHRGLQSFWLEQQLQRAQVSGQSDVFQYVPGMMLDMIKGAKRDTFKAVFNDAESRKQVMTGVQAIRRIMLNNQRTGGRSLPKVKELAGVLASRNKTFAARLAADMFAPDLVAKFAIDPQGVKALQVLSLPYDTKRATAALTTLSDILNRDNAVSPKPYGVSEQ